MNCWRPAFSEHRPNAAEPECLAFPCSLLPVGSFSSKLLLQNCILKFM